MLLSAFDDKEYMAWYKQNASMSNPEIEYGAWLAGKASAEARADSLAAQLATAQAERDAAIKASQELGYTIRMTRIGWDNTVTCNGVLDPISERAKAIGVALGIDRP